tara:strand:+ start:750 stop:950 length:201 start_codon:yes stop_codon:yes gene_type:complete
MEFLDNVSLNTIVWSVLAILEVVVRLTPSQKDNSILNKVMWIVDKIIPNKSKSGKFSHKTYKTKAE